MLFVSCDALHRDTFDKGYLRIIKIENIAPPVYELADLQDKQLLGTFYDHETST